MVHSLERVDYLIMEQSYMRDVATLNLDSGDFLKDGEVKMDFKYLGSTQPNQKQKASLPLLTIASVVTAALLLGFLVYFACRAIYARLTISEAKINVKFDCEQAILKKYKLENSS